MAESKTLVTRGVLAVLIALALSAVLFVYTENIPIMTEMEARSALLAGKAPSAGASETAPTATTTQVFREGLSVTTVTIYATTGTLAVQSENDKAPTPFDTTVTETGVVALVTTVTRTVTVNVTVTVTRTR